MNIRIDKLNPFFRDTFTSIAEDYFLPNEDVEWLGDIAEATKDDNEYFPFGFAIITTRRIFRVLFYPEIKFLVGPSHEPIHRPFFHFEHNGSYRPSERSKLLIAPLTSGLTDYEKKSIYIFETQIRNLIDIRRNNREVSQLDIKLLSTQKIGNTIKISDIKIMVWPDDLINFCLYNPEDGREVYMVLQHIIDQNIGKYSFTAR